MDASTAACGAKSGKHGIEHLEDTVHPQMTADDMQLFLRREFPQVADDFAIERITSDAITVRLLVADRHLRPGGTVSGPSMFALADVSVYLAVMARLGPVALAVTTNCAMDFMRKPAAGSDLIAIAEILKLGRNLAVGDVRVFSEGGTVPVARATLTYSIPPGTTRSTPS